MKKFFCVVFVLLFLSIVFATDTNFDLNRVFSANIHLNPTIILTPDQNQSDLVVLPSDSGKYYWFVKDNQNFYAERYMAGEDFLKLLLFDFSQKEFVFYDTNSDFNSRIPSNVLPLLKANSNNVLTFSVAQSADTSKLFFVIKHLDGSISETEKLHGEEAISLTEGDLVFVLFDGDDYGLVSFSLAFSERYLTLKFLITEKMPLEDYYLTLPSKDDCVHWMDANESRFYCGFEHEFCASKAKDLGCTIEEIITCNTDACLDRLVKEGKIAKSDLQNRIEELQKSTIPEVKARVDVLSETVRDLNKTVEQTSQETQNVFDWGTTLTLVSILIVVVIAIIVLFVREYLLKKAGVSKENELDFLEKNNFEEVINNGVQKEDSGNAGTSRGFVESKYTENPEKPKSSSRGWY